MSRTVVRLSARDYNATITPAQLNSQVQGNSNRNLIINGAMNVAQRATSATGIGTTAAYNTVDRWRFADLNNPPARFTQTQSTDAPDGFSSSHKFEVTTNDSSVDDDEMQFTDQFIEAQNLQLLKYGTSSAVSITLSFYVKSSVASTMGLRINHEDGGGNYGASYTINSVNTWERKSITVPGNTATAINNDNGKGLRIGFALSAGADYAGSNSTAWGNGNTFGAHTNTFVGTSSATWQITGVQLEIGSNATEFEHETFDTTLIKCQRYYQIIGRDFSDTTPTTAFGWGYTVDGSAAQGMLQFERRMRTKPTFTQSTDQNLDIRTNTGAGAVHASNAFTSIVTSETSAEFTQQNHAGTFGGGGQPYFLKWNGVQGTGLTANVLLVAEL